MSGERYLVCDACGHRSCFEGILHCEDYRTAGTRWETDADDGEPFYPSTTAPPAMVCRRCGALVAEEDVHAAWHEERTVSEERAHVVEVIGRWHHCEVCGWDDRNPPRGPCPGPPRKPSGLEAVLDPLEVFVAGDGMRSVYTRTAAELADAAMAWFRERLADDGLIEHASTLIDRTALRDEMARAVLAAAAEHLEAER